MQWTQPKQYCSFERVDQANDQNETKTVIDIGNIKLSWETLIQSYADSVAFYLVS